LKSEKTKVKEIKMDKKYYVHTI